MSLEEIRAAFGWAALINMAMLMWWFAIFVFAKDWMFSIHSRWFTIERSKYESIHYCGMGIYKLVNFSFFIAPYLALRIIG